MYIFIFDNLVLPKVLDQSWILKFTTLLDLANECNVRIVVDLIISHSNCTKDTLVKLEVSLEQLELRLRVKEIVQGFTGLNVGTGHFVGLFFFRYRLFVLVFFKVFFGCLILWSISLGSNFSLDGHVLFASHFFIIFLKLGNNPVIGHQRLSLSVLKLVISGSERIKAQEHSLLIFSDLFIV